MNTRVVLDVEQRFEFYSSNKEMQNLNIFLPLSLISHYSRYLFNFAQMWRRSAVYLRTNELNGSNTYPITCGTSMEWEDARFRSPAISASLAKSVSWSASRALLRDSSNLTSSIRLVSLIVCKQDQQSRQMGRKLSNLLLYQFLNLPSFKFKYSIPSS